jgi:hypothetical protein
MATKRSRDSICRITNEAPASEIGKLSQLLGFLEFFRLRNGIVNNRSSIKY